MDANPIVIRHWEDVVFENRNKSYGAYLLRRAYSNRLLSGLGVTLMLTAIVLSLQHIQLDETARTVDPPPLIEKGIILTHPPSFEKREPPKNAIQRPRRNTQSQSVVVTTEEVVDEQEVTALTEFVSEGFESGVVGNPEGTSAFSLPEPEVVIEPGVLDIAEVMPQYEGGMAGLMKFIQRKIRYPRAPLEQGIEGTVYVRFVVRGDGSVTDVEVIRGVHPDYDREARRVISMLPDWKGGSNNGRPASVRMVLPIKFNLQ